MPLLPLALLLAGCPLVTDAERLAATDRDGDGFVAAQAGGGDCDDDAPRIHPDAEEVCNDGLDNDCDGTARPCELEGNVSAADAFAVFRGEGIEMGEGRAGTTLLGGTDLDGNGSPDVVVGAPDLDLGGAGDQGGLYVLDRPLAGAHDLSAAPIRLLGRAAGDRLGADLALAPDLSGDGVSDLLVGAPGRGDEGGAVYLVAGPLDPGIALGSPVLEGGEAGDRLGAAVAFAADVTGDGVGDLLVGAPGADGGVGRAWVMPGPLSGSSTLDDAAAVLHWGRDGDAAGAEVAGVGDIDGDGVSDVALGAPEGSGTRRNGVLFLHPGPLVGDLEVEDAAVRLLGPDEGSEAGARIVPAGDVDGDGRGDVLVSAPRARVDDDAVGIVYLLAGHPFDLVALVDATARLEGFDHNDAMGSGTAGIGDLDRDGHGDILLGAPGRDAGGQDSGSVWLWYGPLAGTLAPTRAAYQVVGEQWVSEAGAAVAAAGDVNEDGCVDFLVAAPGWSDGEVAAGSVYVFLGLGL